MLIGVTYKSGISDTRESPASEVARILIEKGARVSYFDPLVESWALGTESPLMKQEDPISACQEQDIVILLQMVKDCEIKQIVDASPIFFDTRGVVDSDASHRL